MVRTYVRFLTPGAFFAEEYSVEVPGRDPAAMASIAKPEAFAFQFYSVSVLDDEEGRELISSQFDVSCFYYIDALVYTADQLAEISATEYRTVIDNMRSNGWDKVAFCRTGNFRPLLEGDEVIFSGNDDRGQAPARQR